VKRCLPRLIASMRFTGPHQLMELDERACLRGAGEQLMIAAARPAAAGSGAAAVQTPDGHAGQQLRFAEVDDDDDMLEGVL